MCVCGECEYYVPRPPEVSYRCALDGVCLSRGRAVDSTFTANRLYGGTVFIIGRGQVCSTFRKKKQ